MKQESSCLLLLLRQFYHGERTGCLDKLIYIRISPDKHSVGGVYLNTFARLEYQYTLLCIERGAKRRGRPFASETLDYSCVTVVLLEAN